MGLSVSEIKSERTDGVIRRELVSEESARRPEQLQAPGGMDGDKLFQKQPAEQPRKHAHR